MQRVIYPGSFDPLTNGHLDIIERGSGMFDEVVIAISQNAQKKHMFSLEERKRMVLACIKPYENVKVEIFSGLLVDYAKSRKAVALLRGLRATSDFDYEFQLANMNRKLAGDVHTIFMMTGEASYYISSTLVKEVAGLGGDVRNFVPAPVLNVLNQHYAVRKSS
jgi:pantetheine-phosphate adenylyltransferase